MKGILFNRFNQVRELVSSYNYPENPALHLSRYLKSNKKLGSKDRRQLKQWYYAYFKLAIVYSDLDEILWGTLHADQSATLEPLRNISTYQKENIQVGSFPLKNRISDKLDESVIEELISEKPIWAYKNIKSAAFDEYHGLHSYPQGFQLLGDVIIQDLASFQISEITKGLISEKMSSNEVVRFWDACCGAGGKSLMIAHLLDNLPSAWLLSDKRAHILLNAKKRFLKEQKQRIQFTEIDLVAGNEDISQSLLKKGQQYFDLILLDVPCSGSGTWGRNPQHLRNFCQEDLTKYIHLQKSIIKGAEPFLSNQGILVYSTCSVYEDENEKQTQWICNELGLELIESKYLGRATSDTMYIAVFNKIDVS
jgi:16S rRNA (cytosine967-C5)-methyltransferase